MGASWLRIEASPVPVFESGPALAWHLRTQGRRAVLSPGQVDVLAGAVAGAAPLGGSPEGREEG